MRPYLLAACISIAAPLVLVYETPDASAQFDPSGRNRPKPPPNPGGAAPKKPPRPAPAAPDAAPAEDKRSPDALIPRYTAIVMSQPGAAFPLSRLAQLYRDRDGNLKKLIEEFEQRAQAKDDTAFAARVALAGIYKQDGRYEDAIRTYESAIADKPSEPAPVMALAELKSDQNDKAGARALYEKALPLLTVGAEVEQTRRTLLNLSLDLKDFEGAKAHHDDLVKRGQGSLFVKAELGRALMVRNHFERAEAEFRELVKAAAGDNRALAPALKDLGESLAKQKKTKESLEVLQRALSVAGGAQGVRREILFIMTDAFRADGRLPELIVILEKEQGQDFERLATLGTLFEETGNVQRAIETYRKALGVDSRHIDTRIKLVHLLQTAGELDEAIKEYEALIRAAPGSSEFVFQLCETLIQRGDRPKALKLLQELEGRVRGEPEVLAAVADFYERIEEKDLAMALFQRLATVQSGDPHFLIDLGDRYYQAGDKKKALETWARIKALIPNRAQAQATLGEVYLDHDMGAEALAALREAVRLDPSNNRFKKALAIALERTASSTGQPATLYNEARGIWEELLASAAGDELISREARTHIVSLWALTRELPSRVTPLKSKFEKEPPDLEAGRLLAEVLRKLHRLPEAEAALRRIVSLAPGDEQSMLSLERVLVQQQNLKGAIAVLEKLAEANPQRARQYYQRMAQYAAELYLDDDAIRYAAKAVELSPNDAGGHQKLGDMYKRRQDIPKAIAEYRQAISKNDRLFPVYFDLAELLLSSGEVDEADMLFRRVVRSARDEELVARAARMSMQVNLGRGQLESLERELLPAAVGNPQRPLYRRLLVELYGAMTLPLVQKIRHARGATDAEAQKAREELSAIGARAVKPLLDALSDDKESQQKIAIEVLAYVENKSAGPSLFNFATGQADKQLRVRAMVATGALRDAELIPKLEALLAPSDAETSLAPSDSVAVAAAWVVARMQSPKADKLLVRLLDAPSPDVRAVAAIGLGLTKNAKHIPSLMALAKSQEAGPTARAAAIVALGEMSAAAQNAEVLALLQSATDAKDLDLRRAALLAAARLSAGGALEASEIGVTGAIANAIFSDEADLSRDAALAATVLATGRFTRDREPLPVPDGPLTVRGVLSGLGPDPFDAPARAEAQIQLKDALRSAAIAAVGTSPSRARVVADAIDARAGFLGPFRESGDELAPELAGRLRATVDHIAAGVVPGFVALVRHPSVDVRTQAVEFLGARVEASAQKAIIDALGDPEEVVRRAALSAVGPVKSDALVNAVARQLSSSKSWPLRVRASEALGRLAAGGDLSTTSAAAASSALRDAAESDSFALVREAALRAFVDVDPRGAPQLLSRLAQSDEEPRVRKAAQDLLKQSP